MERTSSMERTETVINGQKQFLVVMWDPLGWNWGVLATVALHGKSHFPILLFFFPLQPNKAPKLLATSSLEKPVNLDDFPLFSCPRT
ncbi:hypothetical protein SLEP1_g48778 [Rubroshorea leprosula]|uniref:Uncharacterized protein n=1 Tax=Rubroshorea leprosula TaxID=152421 RepID=A0AAV5LXK7_9ROSI|nr:hypothetical protein SLEP1_g48778 [Rubroshorea leprosula]